MATIQTSIILTDRVSGVLQNIMRSLDATNNSFNRLNNSTQNVMNSGDLVEIRSSLDSINNQYRQIVDQINNAGNSQRRFNNEVNNGSNSVGGFLKNIIAMGAAYFSFDAIIGAVKSAVDYASDLVEVQNVVDVTFGNMAEDINQWSQTTSSAFGISELTAKQYSSTLGAMMKSGGLAGDTMKNMSINMTQLAADMASFYNLESDVAFDKIRSGLSGETEPLKALGIDMSATGLEAYRMAQGIDVSYNSMDNASKMVLRYQYLMSQTADAQGDFSRTQDSFANQTRLLGQSWENFTGQLASNALPILTELVYVLNSGLQLLSGVGQVVSDNWSIIAPILAAALGILVTYNATMGIAWLTTLQKVGASIAHAAATALEYAQIFILIAAQDGLNAAMAACPLSWIIMGIMLIIAAVVALVAAFNKWQGTSVSVIGLIGGLIGGLVATIINSFLGIYNVVAIVVNFLANVFINPVAAIKSLFYDMAVTIIGYFETIGNAIQNILNKIPGVEVDFMSGLTNFKNQLKEASSSVKDKAGLKDVMQQIDYVDTSKFINDGYNLGVSAKDWVMDKITPGATSPGEYLNLDDYDFKKAANDTAKNTSDIKDNLDVSNEHLQYLRDIAERDVINRFTTDNFKFEFTNNNNARNIDGVVDKFADELREYLNGGGEGAPAVV